MNTPEYQALLSEFKTLKSEEEIEAFKAKMTEKIKNRTSKENDLALSFLDKQFSILEQKVRQQSISEV